MEKSEVMDDIFFLRHQKKYFFGTKKKKKRGNKFNLYFPRKKVIDLEVPVNIYSLAIREKRLRNGGTFPHFYIVWTWISRSVKWFAISMPYKHLVIWVHIKIPFIWLSHKTRASCWDCNRGGNWKSIKHIVPPIIKVNVIEKYLSLLTNHTDESFGIFVKFHVLKWHSVTLILRRKA